MLAEGIKRQQLFRQPPSTLSKPMCTCTLQLADTGFREKPKAEASNSLTTEAEPV